MKNKIIGNGNTLELSDGTTIKFYHKQIKNERVYADLTALEDTGFFEDASIKKNNIDIEYVDGFGIFLNDYEIPFYNSNDDNDDDSIIKIIIKNADGKIIRTRKFDCGYWGIPASDDDE